MKENLELKGIANVKILEKFQNLFFNLTGLYTTFIDTNGDFVTSDRGKQPFCLLVAKLGLERKCRESDYNACKKVITTKKPFIYQCFAGLTEIISPIIVNNRVLGAALAGQIRVKNLNKLSLNKSTLPENVFSKLKTVYKKVPVLTSQQVDSAAKLLFLLINYIIKIEYEIIVYREIEKYKTHSQEIVKKVMKFITENYSQNISLRSLAEQFFISPFYLCHIFKKETGSTITNYLSKVRLDNAVRLLKNPTIPIKQIPYQVGYSDEYYFYKVFKKAFQITPANFRKQYFSP